MIYGCRQFTLALIKAEDIYENIAKDDEKRSDTSNFTLERHTKNIAL